MKSTFVLPVFILWLFASSAQVTAQDSTKYRKNTIYVNVTNPLLFGPNAYRIGYERVLNPKRSFTVMVGAMDLPSFIDDGSIGNDTIQLSQSSKDKGLHFSGEYRFYLAKENKYPAPRGVYLAPYYSYNGYSRTNTWELNTNTFQGNATTDLDLKIHTLGVEFGYQFIFWNRLTLDLILIGPGISSYQFKAKLDTDLSADEESELFDRLNEFLEEKIPGYNLVIDDQEFKSTGTTNTTSIGWRYMFNIGFRF